MTPTVGLFTLVSNPSEEDVMPAAASSSTRALDRPGRNGKTPAKTPAKKQATLVLANGADQSEAVRVGLSLVGAGITGVAIGVLEGMARAGKVKWYGGLSAGKKATLLLAIFFAAGLLARQRRKAGDYKSASTLEAAAMGAFTVAVIVMTEAGMQDDKKDGDGVVRGLLDGGADKALAKLSHNELNQLDELLDDDIKRAASEIRRMAEEQAVREGVEVEGLVPFGAVEDDDDDFEFDYLGG